MLKTPDFPGLIVEVTETEAIADPQLVRDIAIQMRLNNIFLSIDDFGAGQSSIERLSQIPFTELKLDAAFVNGCAKDEELRQVCRDVLAIARRSNVIALAEGVESGEDLKVVAELGFDLAQGYYFGEPMMLDDYLDKLSSSGFTGGDR